MSDPRTRRHEVYKARFPFDENHGSPPEPVNSFEHSLDRIYKISTVVPVAVVDDEPVDFQVAFDPPSKPSL